MSVEVYERLQREVIERGLCTHCGTCVGVSSGTLTMTRTDHGPIPLPSSLGPLTVDAMAYDACPGLAIHYPTLFENIFGRMPENWLVGCYIDIFLGYSKVPGVRRRGSSGGIITQSLLHLMEEGLIQGAVVLKHGYPKPWLSSPKIVRSEEEICAASQSVYVPSPVNIILEEMTQFEGRLAYVGLPDQVASLRRLQHLGHPGAEKVDYILGPYMGTSMYLGAIESLLRAHRFSGLEEVNELRYREGEWPGYLQIRTNTGKTLRVEKFYYNYLIPFYITTSAMIGVDFTNELTDVSVGDAWRPDLEAKGEGYSVIVARSNKGYTLLQDMLDRKSVHLEKIALDEALSMHGHMIDFKKRGAFIRMDWRKAVGMAVPDYGYRPEMIPFSRRAVEIFILGILLAGRTRVARWLVERIPLRVLGPVFNTFRKTWKGISKPTKRRGLKECTFIITRERSESSGWESY